MDKCYLLSTSMVVPSLDSKNYIFCSKKDDEQVFGPKVLFPIGISVLM